MISRVLSPTTARLVSFVRGNGYTLCILDFTRSSKAAAAGESLKDLHALLREAALDAPLRVLTDVTGARLPNELIGILERFASANEAVVERSAIIGLSLAQRVVLRKVRRSTGRDIREFETRDEALAYLTAE